MARVQNCTAPRCCEVEEITKPPTSPEEIREGHKQRKHEHGAEHARGDEFARGVGAHGAHGVDLLGDQHRAEFGGDAGGVAAGDEEAGDGRAEFAHQADGDDVAGELSLSVSARIARPSAAP
jgi:hypothetical protein